MRDHYEVLGVPRDASEADIGSAYRKKALLHHPDRNPGDGRAAEQFRESTRAYEVLKDPDRRREYDMSTDPYGLGGEPQGPGGPDFFNSMWNADFRARRHSNNARRHGEDVEHELVLTVEEAVLGATKKVVTQGGEEVVCERCSGTRSEPGTRKILCTRCAGSGKHYPTQNVGTSRCRACDGHGDRPSRKCVGCEGAGKVRASREISVKVPAGISDGQKLRVAGLGGPGLGGPPGDLFVTIRVAEGGRFSRRGNDLHTVLRVPFHQAMGHLEGGQAGAVTVRGVDGREHVLDLFAGFRPGETDFVIPGAGVGGMGGPRGNMHVVVHVDLPEPRTARASALVRELVDELAGGGARRWVPPDADG